MRTIINNGIKNICVFCGSSSGHNPIYSEMAERLAISLSRRKIGIVYGGGNIGLMGRLADAMLGAGGSVIGVIPESMVKRELAHKGVTQLLVVQSMYERKALMVALSDAFIALPGGVGTFDELFEVITLRQLGIHSKPCGILNVNNYFDGFIEQINRSVEEGFLTCSPESIFLISSDLEELIEKLISINQRRQFSNEQVIH